MPLTEDQDTTKWERKLINMYNKREKWAIEQCEYRDGLYKTLKEHIGDPSINHQELNQKIEDAEHYIHVLNGEMRLIQDRVDMIRRTRREQKERSGQSTMRTARTHGTVVKRVNTLAQSTVRRVK